MTKQAFTPRRHDLDPNHDPGQGHRPGIEVYNSGIRPGRVSLWVMDKCEDMTLTRLSPDQARAIAQDLNAAADFIDAQTPEIGETIQSLGQLNGLPEGAVVIDDSGRPFLKGAPGRPNHWQTAGSSSNVGPVVTYTFHSPLKLAHLPESSS